MENEILKQILATQNEILANYSEMKATQNEMLARLDSVESKVSRLDVIEGDVKSIKFRLDSLEQNVTDIKTQQIKDSGTIQMLFENSIDITERVTGHDLAFDALQSALEERNKTDAAF